MAQPPSMDNHTIRLTPRVWAKVEARAAQRDQRPATWIRLLVEREVENDPDPDLDDEPPRR